MTASNPPQSSGSVPPNQGALNLYKDPAFQQLVESEVVDCSQLAQELQTASGNEGGQIVINPPPGTDRVKHPVGGEVAKSNYHVVYTDGNYVFDPRHDGNGAIPRAVWEAKITELNGEMEFEFFPAQPEEPTS